MFKSTLTFGVYIFLFLMTPLFKLLVFFWGLLGFLGLVFGLNLKKNIFNKFKAVSIFFNFVI